MAVDKGSTTLLTNTDAISASCSAFCRSKAIAATKATLRMTSNARRVCVNSAAARLGREGAEPRPAPETNGGARKSLLEWGQTREREPTVDFEIAMTEISGLG